MKSIINKHEHFLIGLFYKTNEDGKVSDGELFYVPNYVLEGAERPEQLNHEHLNEVGRKNIEGDSLEEYQERLDQEEKRLLHFYNSVGHEKVEKIIKTVTKEREI